MTDLPGQLDTVRRRGRRLLVLQQSMLFASAVLISLFALGWLDFLLRFPGWFRLILAGALWLWAVAWLVAHVRQALRFNPDLAALALRLEAMYPQLSGKLASAVEFDQDARKHGDAYASMPEMRRAAAMQRASLARVSPMLEHVQVDRLIDYTSTLRRLVLLVACAVVSLAMLFAVPAYANAALWRWVAPFLTTNYPKATQLTPGVAAEVWPADEPLPLRAEVNRGYREGMTVSAYYQVVDPDGTARSWQRVLLNEQTLNADPDSRSFEQFLDLPAMAADPAAVQTLNFYFAAGDDQTDVQTIRRVTRPAVDSFIATIDPPAYAAGLAPSRSVSIHESAGNLATVLALQGATIQLELTTNKPLELSQATALMPGASSLQWQATDITGKRFTAEFTLDEPIESTLNLTDGYGMVGDTSRRYRFEPTLDAAPSATISKPAADITVLPTAIIPLAASGRDDVGLKKLAIEAMFLRTPDEPTADVSDQAADQPRPEPVTIMAVENRRPTMELQATFDVARFELTPGDTAEITAVAWDVFDLHGMMHEPARSTVRRIRIIDENEFVQQVRGELAQVRQAASRIRERQAELNELKDKPDVAAKRQAALSERLDAQTRAMDQVEERIERNRLDDDVLNETMQRAQQLIQQARAASEQARAANSKAAQAKEQAQAQEQREQDALEQGQSQAAAEAQQAREAAEQQQAQAQEQAEQAREEVDQKLDELIDLLDQGRDVAALQRQLEQLEAMQQQAAASTRQMLARTAGKFREDLPEDLQQALDDLSDQQEQLAEQARELAQDMENTADNLENQSEDDRDRAAAEALREAARIAQQQGLAARMQQAGESIEQNQMAEAGSFQQQSQDAIEQMMQAMDSQRERMAKMLRRRLEKLAEAIERLVRRQQAELAQLQKLQGDVGLPGLEPGMMNLRIGTMAVEVEARSPQTQTVAVLLGEAVTEQANAIRGLRASDRPMAKLGEDRSLGKLQQALEQTRQAAEDAAQDEAREKREELRQQYEQLARQQDDLRDKVEAKQAENLPARRARLDYVDFGHEQADIQAALRELAQASQGEDTTVFPAMHERLDQLAARITAELRRGRANASVPRQQQQIAAMLRAMARSLEDDKKDNEFDDPPASNQQQDGGGGGAPPQAIPPAAELKLLRELQTLLKLETQGLADEFVQLDGAEQRTRLIDLSTRQRELGELGQTMMQKVQKSMQPPGANIRQAVEEALPGEGDGDAEGEADDGGDPPGDPGNEVEMDIDLPSLTPQDDAS